MEPGVELYAIGAGGRVGATVNAQCTDLGNVGLYNCANVWPH
jgi:hypothetical protein